MYTTGGSKVGAGGAAFRYNPNNGMVQIQAIRVEVDREEDGRVLASVPELPGVMAYGGTEEEAIRKVKSIALQVLAEMIEGGCR